MHPKDISINDYSYSLPEERIAAIPLPERSASSLLIYKNGEITRDVYENITDHIPSNSLLIFNNTKVVHARLLFQKPSGGIIEIFCLEPTETQIDPGAAMLQTGKLQWKCLVGGISKWKPGQLLQKLIRDAQPTPIKLTARYIAKTNDAFIIELAWSPPALSFAELLEKAGALPLPPYIKRQPDELDAERYQTVYAGPEGSVAAPTAGLHFTNRLFEKLEEKNIPVAFVTLHVGAGTFKPVKSATMTEHEMHAEFIDVSRATIETIAANLSNNRVAVGTTSFRTVETLYWLGVKTIVKPDIQPQDLQLFQWEVYDELPQTISASDALRSLLEWMKNNALAALQTTTQLLIAPGYTPKIINGLITNFHQPHSTLLLLVAAFIGSDWKKVYEYAMENDFRFLSYGDGSLLWYSGL